MNKSTVFIVFYFLFVFRNNAQLIGTYTVGSASDDFPTIEGMINSINQNGIGGTVVFKISSGNYANLQLIDVIPPASAKVIFTSLTENAADVIFEKGSITDCERIEFHDLSFIMPSPGTEYSLLNVVTSRDVRILRCRIIDNYNSDTVWYYGALEIDVGWSSGMHNVFIDSCFVQSLENQLSYAASRQTVLIKGNAGKTFFHSDTILGSFDFTFNESREFKKCLLFTNEDISELGTSFIDSCEIHLGLQGYNGQGSYDLKANQITNNSIFTYGGVVHLWSKTVLNNYIQGEANFVGGGNSLHRNNYIEGNMQYYTASAAIGGINALIESNIIAGESWISGISAIPTIVANNSFLGQVTSNGPGSTINYYHNNFKEGNTFYCLNFGEMINNNFGDVYFLEIGSVFLNGNQAVNLSNNNYNILDSSSFYFSYFDNSPKYNDPNYDSSSGLHIGNPAIYSSAIFMPQAFLTYDMDDEDRDQIRSIGSDETCLSMPLPDTIALACGTHYVLEYCDVLNNGFQWEPPELFVDSTAVFPKVLIDTVKTLYLLDQFGNNIDSIVFMPFNISSRNRDLYGYCTIEYNIATYNQDGASINWSPGSLFSDSTSYLTSISLDTTTEIVAIQDLGECGIRYDSITFHITTTPQSFFHVETADCLGRGFESFTLCFDSCRWEISDGTIYENVTEIWHEFPSIGYYEITYMVWMDGVIDVYLVSGIINCVGVGTEEIEKWNFNLYPNPTDAALFIDVADELIGEFYHIMNLAGQTVMEGKILNSKNRIELWDLKDGVYVVKLRESSKKLIIHK